MTKTLKIIACVFLLVFLASQACAGESKVIDLAEFERITSSLGIKDAVYDIIPPTRIKGLLSEVILARNDLQIIEDRLMPVGTKEVFQHLGTKVKSTGIPNVIAIKQLDEQAVFDWELAVSRNLEVVAVACNYRF